MFTFINTICWTPASILVDSILDENWWKILHKLGSKFCYFSFAFIYIYIYIFPRRFWHTLTLARLTKFHGRMFKGLIYVYVTYSLFVEIVRNKAINCLIMLGCNILFVDFVNATLNDGQLFVEIELLKREKWKCI